VLPRARRGGALAARAPGGAPPSRTPARPRRRARRREPFRRPRLGRRVPRRPRRRGNRPPRRTPPRPAPRCVALRSGGGVRGREQAEAKFGEQRWMLLEKSALEMSALQQREAPKQRADGGARAPFTKLSVPENRRKEQEQPGRPDHDGILRCHFTNAFPYRVRFGTLKPPPVRRQVVRGGGRPIRPRPPPRPPAARRAAHCVTAAPRLTTGLVWPPFWRQMLACELAGRCGRGEMGGGAARRGAGVVGSR
jgi:hypothetical protein